MFLYNEVNTHFLLYNHFRKKYHKSFNDDYDVYVYSSL